MSVSLARYADGFRNGDPDQMYRGFREMALLVDSLHARIGRDALQFVDNPNLSKLQVPPPAQFQVVGIDGKFFITIVNPQSVLAVSPTILADRARLGGNVNLTPMLHQVHSGLDVNFNNNSGLTDYGISSQLSYIVQDPNVVKFFRLRSSFDGKNWNPWQIYSSALTCGPVGVQSGLLRTAALTVQNAANTPFPQPLTQSGTSTRILVAQNTATFGSAPNAVYNSGSVDPGAYGLYYIYALDPTRAAGTVTYIASTSNPDVTNNDALIYFGKITTVGGGGGTGTGGGTGPCCVAEARSPLFDGRMLPQSSLRKGMALRGVDGGEELIERIELVPSVPCFRYRGDNGLVLSGCSAQHSLQYDGGGFDHAFLIISGHRVETEKGPTRVTREFIGHRTVYRLHLGGGTKTYIADGFYSHNVIKL